MYRYVLQSIPTIIVGKKIRNKITYKYIKF